MFHKGAFRLAGLYLLVMMAVSLFFSVIIYRLSVQEIDQGLRGPDQTSIINRLPTVESRGQLHDAFELHYQRAKSRIMDSLIITNLVILAGGGALCYYLARRTLMPIEEAREAQNRFTADASHELRTPITAIRTVNEVTLMNPRLTLKQAKIQLRSNVEELEKLTRLTDGLLTLANFENTEITFHNLSVDSLVRKAANRLASKAAARRITIEHSVPKGLKVAGDETSLVEALVILLDNAVKYSLKNGKITISVSRRQKQLKIDVTDRGIGIKPEEIGHIFERFYRADSARSKQQIDGYGLGLAIAKNIAKLHRGYISVKSKAGQGSTFSLVLPLAPA